MKKYMLFSLVAILSTRCQGQDKNDSILAQQEVKVPETTKGSWKVNKEVDENGNLIRYDSIYSWSSPNDPKASDPNKMDTISKAFHSYFGSRAGAISADPFANSRGEDSLLIQNFFEDGLFNDPLFINHFGNQKEHLNEIMKQMDSLQMLFREPSIKSDSSLKSPGRDKF